MRPGLTVALVLPRQAALALEWRTAGVPGMHDRLLLHTGVVDSQPR